MLSRSSLISSAHPLRNRLTAAVGKGFNPLMEGLLQVDLAERSYPIYIGEDLLPQLGALCKERGLNGNSLCVSDTNVAPLYLDVCMESLRAHNYQCDWVTVPAGEPSKSQEQLFCLYDKALSSSLDRKSFVVALGGGVVGDLGGYLAASYLRGIPFIQIPTSLLAMVDSSVGGKTGINLPRGKNLVGAFHQPSLVLADLSTLQTLPWREFLAGMAEVIKYGIIWDRAFFEMLEADYSSMHPSNTELLRRVVTRCCEIKAEVVRRDEREGGLRAILNFGHTLGHAIENAAGYGTYLHGEAVAIGMAFAARVSVRLASMSAGEAERIVLLLDKLGLPVHPKGLGWESLLEAMRLDKKVQSGMPRFVLADSIGSVRTGFEVPEQLLREEWDGFRQ